METLAGLSRTFSTSPAATPQPIRRADISQTIRLRLRRVKGDSGPVKVHYMMSRRLESARPLLVRDGQGPNRRTR